MKKRIFKILFLTFVIFAPAGALAGVSVHVDIPLPPPIIFPAPPHVVVIPETHVYAVPDIPEDIFFYGGWWWRPWQGRWYRSRYYDRGWVHYPRPPVFHRHVPPGWRNYYKEHRWKEYPWQYRHIPHQDLQRNWRHWKRNRYWEREKWGLQKHPKDRYERQFDRKGPYPEPDRPSGPRPPR